MKIITFIVSKNGNWYLWLSKLFIRSYFKFYTFDKSKVLRYFVFKFLFESNDYIKLKSG